MTRVKRFKIYQTRWHLIATIVTILIPILALLIFAEVTQITLISLVINLILSISRLVSAYFIALILAWIFALASYKGNFSSIALPIFDVLQSFPSFAAMPIAVYFWGPSNQTIIFFLVITVIWPILFSVISSLRLIKHDWEEAVEIANLKGINYFRHFLIPASIPGIITGSIIGLGEGWEALVGTEMIVNAKNGVGPFFQKFSSNPIITAFAILGLLLIIFSVNKIIWLPLLELSHKKMEE